MPDRSRDRVRPSALSSGLPSLLLAVAVVAAPLMVGSVHVASTAVLAVLCVAALLVWLVVSRAGKVDGVGVTLAAIGLVVVFLWQLGTIVPLPASLLERLSPRVADLLDVPWAEGLWVRQISYAPGTTAWELLKLGGAVAAFTVAAQIGRDDARGHQLVIVVCGAATLVALLGVLQTVSGTDRALWFYTPESHIPLGANPGVLLGFRTPFVNPNHGAQCLELGCVVAFTLAAFGGDRGRGLLLVAGSVCLLGVLATGSVGGRIALGAGFLFLGSLWLASVGSRLAWVRWLVPAALVIVGLVGLVFVSRAEPGHAELPGWSGKEELRKGATWPSTMQMIRDHSWTGIGRGAYRDAYPRYAPPDERFTRSYVENEVLQVLVDLGLPAGSVLLLGLLLTWAAALRGWRGQVHVAAALVGVLTLAVHNYAGFGLEIGGIGLPFVVLLGVAAAHGGLTVTRPGWRLTTLAIPASLAVGSLVLIPLVWQHGDFRKEVRGLAQRSPEIDVETQAAPSLRWHPTSTDLSLAMAREHLEVGNHTRSLQWLSRTMYLAPAEARPHYLAARQLADLGYEDQALLEIQIALGMETTDTAALLALVRELADDQEEVEAALGDDPVLLARYAESLLVRDPSSELARVLIAELDPSLDAVPEIATARATARRADGDLGGAIESLRAAHERHPEQIDVTLLLARYLRQSDDPAEARAVAEEGLVEAPDDWRLWIAVSDANVDLGDSGEARRDLNQARRAAGSDTWGRYVVASREGDLLHREGDLLGARDSYLLALRYRPHKRVARVKLARVYEELGQPRQALREYRQIEESGQATAEDLARIDELAARYEP